MPLRGEWISRKINQLGQVAFLHFETFSQRCDPGSGICGRGPPSKGQKTGARMKDVFSPLGVSREYLSQILDRVQGVMLKCSHVVL